MTAAAFYMVCDRRYFLGAAAAINSLRLLGHDEPVFVLDLGLSPEQREILSREATVVAGEPGPPYLAKTQAPLANPAAVMVLIDVDMALTRPAADLIATAAAGRVVAFEDRAGRYFAEWDELLGLGGISPGPYVGSGFVALGGEPGMRVLTDLHAKQEAVDFARTHYGSDDPAYPFRFPEQDVLNALLRADGNAGVLEALPERLAPTPPFRELRVADAARLRCRYPDGEEPYLVHHHGPKPWLTALDDGVYSRLLRRLLSGDDVALRPPPQMLPARLRPGIGGYVRRRIVDLRWWIRWHVRREPIAASPNAG